MGWLCDVVAVSTAVKDLPVRRTGRAVQRCPSLAFTWGVVLCRSVGIRNWLPRWQQTEPELGGSGALVGRCWFFAGLAVCQLAEKVEVTEVAGGLLDQVVEDPPQGTRDVGAGVIETVVGDDLVATS
jgi:hypothetical protein